MRAYIDWSLPENKSTQSLWKKFSPPNLNGYLRRKLTNYLCMIFFFFASCTIVMASYSFDPLLNCIRLCGVLCNCTVTLITWPPSPSRPLQINFSAAPVQPFHSVSTAQRPIRLCPTSAALCVTPQPFKALFFRQRLLHHFQLSHSIFHSSLNLRCSSFSEPVTFSSHSALFTVSQKLQHPEDLDPTLPFPYFYLRTYVLPFQTRHTENTNLDIDARPAVVRQLENSLRWRYGVSEAHQPRARLNGCNGEVDL